ncbi:hypothetical protein [Terricaulis sp.]|uniref:hypothetical protein n=1 Tax=Terricaulis sp. TaxID=2768686 RepID=UPI003784F6FF
MAVDEKTQAAVADIGGYLLTKYGGMGGTLYAANAVSALGALAGVFAQAQARAMLASGALANSESSLVEATTTDGQRYYFGDAINACLFEGSRERPSFWNIAAGAAQDPDIGAKIDIGEIAKHTAEVLGSADFGAPRIDARYQLSQMPIDAVRMHALTLLDRFKQTGVDPAKLMVAFGLVGQGFAAFAAGEMPDNPVTVAMTRPDIVRLYMESAIPMSKLDLRALGMVQES